MDFFQAQDKARLASRWLVVLFLLSVISLILLTDLLFTSLLFYGQRQPDQDFIIFAVGLGAEFHITIILLVSLVVVAGTLYKSHQLRGGGHTVADMLGGRLVPQNSQDPLQRRLLNVVEEMAIAAGVTVPPVYILANERSINAFAAGHTTDNAIICVTQGCLEALDRDALQGVVAHEFSHILNGDMRLNIKITGILHGILLLGLIGARILHIVRHVRSSRNNGAAAIGLVGLGLVAIGFGGTLFGNAIKATVNRQREFLADASAVQFTRNPAGMANALKAIGGYVYGSRLFHPAADEASHFFFASGTQPLWQAFFATHPPLEQRIRRIEPSWDGSYTKIKTSFTEKVTSEEITNGKQRAKHQRQQHITSAAIIVAADQALNQLQNNNQGNIGQISPQQLNHAQQLITSLPLALKTAAHDPYDARALIYALLLNEDHKLRQEQHQVVADNAEPGVPRHLNNLHKILASINREAYLPLVEMAIPTLDACSPQQKQRFMRIVNRLIRHDNHVSLFEWCLKTIIENSLFSTTAVQYFGQKRIRKLNQLAVQTRVILSLLVHSGDKQQTNNAVTQQVFNQAMAYLELPAGEIYTQNMLPFVTLENALKQLDRLAPLDKKRFLEACIMTAKTTESIQLEELEIIRAIAAALHCPLALVDLGAQPGSAIQ